MKAHSPGLVARAAVFAILLAVAPAGAQAQDSRPVDIVVGAGNRLTVAGRLATLGSLVPTLDKVTGADHDRPVVIRARASTPMGVVAGILERLKRGGYAKAALIDPSAKPGL